MCDCSEEMIDHLLTHCEIAYALWSKLFMIFGIHWVLLDKVASLPFFLDGAIDSKSILQMCGIGASVCDVISEKGAKQPYILGDCETY